MLICYANALTHIATEYENNKNASTAIEHASKKERTREVERQGRLESVELLLPAAELLPT